MIESVDVMLSKVVEFRHEVEWCIKVSGMSVLRCVGLLLVVVSLIGCGNRTRVGNLERGLIDAQVLTKKGSTCEIGPTEPDCVPIEGATEAQRQNGSAGVTSRDIVATSIYDLNDVSYLVRFNGRLSEEYLKLSDRVATEQDVAALSVLSTAAVAAYGAATDATVRQITGVGLLGLSINQGAAYLDPQGTSDALLRASKRSLCIAGAARRYEGQTEGPSDTGFGIIAEGMIKSRFILRDELTRGRFPDYATLVDDYATTLAANIEANRDLKSAGFLSSADGLTQEVQGCLLPSSGT
ncbi:hypothetical protein MWU60_19360 [Yoonia sp. F2084L]|uniref:hypothetical protein n=1 Tax=Yoonia sp. F2084L TaxID=2926419 RepID=UPI001FF11D48|nr:hypothetical protein [Yoonia sp. F2084L]MCK0097740.1 hypothetical protein [Yoonia sp. F2084L]